MIGKDLVRRTFSSTCVRLLLPLHTCTSMASSTVTSSPIIFFFSINTLRVGDLGLATNTSQDRITKAGTFFFMSPQALFGKQYGAKTDVYSFGCIAYNMLMRETPYVTEDVFALD
eukprot:Rmarinus@m.15378